MPPQVGQHQVGARRKPKRAAQPLKLTPKQAIFVREYLIDLNATRAATAAGYSQKTAEAAASRLLRNVKVRAEIDKQKAERSERLEISADRVLQELARLAFLDPRRFFNADGTAKAITALDEGWSPKTAAQKAALESAADILFFGGAAGSLKTETMLVDAARESGNPNLRAIIFRTVYSNDRHRG